VRDESDAADPFFLRPAPEALKFDLDLATRREHHHGSVDGAHRLPALAQEIGISRRVDERDFMLFPMEMVKRRGDAHLVTDLLGLEIEERGAIVHAPEPVHFAGGEQ
jgi:hypothetical protein